jgi:hypothetical protein
MEQTAGKNEGGAFRQLFKEARGEPRSDRKGPSRHKEEEREGESEGLNCLVYKIKSPSQL